MKKEMLLIRSNMRKAKGQMAAIMILMLLASVMLNLWLMLSLDYKKNFDYWHEKLHAGHLTFVLDSDDEKMREDIADILEEDRQTAEYEMQDAYSLDASFEYNGGEVDSDFVILEKEAAISRGVEKIEITEEGDCTSGIYLPLIYGTGEGYSVGDTFRMKLGTRTVSYTVCGFFHSVMMGSHNCSLCALLFTEDKYEELKSLGIARPSTMLSVRIRDKGESEKCEARLKNAFLEKYPDIREGSNSYALVSSSRYISQMICSGVVCAMAFLVILIALVVIAFHMIHYIQENMKNLGALKALGYTSAQLMRTFLIQFLGMTVAAVSAGTGLSYALFPILNEKMISQTGIPYEEHFLLLPFLAVMAVMCGVTVLVVRLTAGRIKKVDPITALRQGVRTHSFKKNHVPLVKTRMPLNTALALKTTFSGMKQNITVSVTMLVLSLIVVFSGLMIENVIVDMTPFVNLIVGETADSCVNIVAGAESEFLREMERDKCVEKIYLCHTIEVRHAGGSALSATISDDFSDMNNQSVCYKGRFPKYENEMAIGAIYAEEKGLQIGDEITLTADGNKASYIITGLTQISNYLGKDCLLTRDAYLRMGRLRDESYYLNLKKGVDVNNFNEEIGQRFGDRVLKTVDLLSALEGMSSVYISLMKLIVVAVLVLSVLIIAFVLYLLVKTMLASKKQDYGIMKALGFTTRQLVLQTALSFMPAVILATVAGMICSLLVINPLTAVFLKGIGIVKCTFAISTEFVMAAGIGLILFAFAAACLLSLRIRKIAPCALLGGE